MPRFTRTNSHWKLFGAVNLSLEHAAWNPRCWRVFSFALVLIPALASGQSFTQQGFFETTFTVYPQTAPGDSGQAISASEAQWEPAVKWGEWHFNALFGADFDSHRMAERKFAVSYWDRSVLRPAFDIQRLSVSWAHGPVTVELGKQLVRWGKTDILIPTDRFAPRDYLNVIDPEYLAVTAARVTIANQTDSLDLVYTPRMTPSRIPLLDQRWVITPQQAQGIALIDGGARYPGGGQYGARWNHLGRYLEYSFSYFRGYNNLPLLQADFVPALGAIDVSRYYVHLQSVGADTAIPLSWITLKAESEYFGSDTPQADKYVLYVVQAERQWHEWLFIGGYTGEYDTEVHNMLGFDPERGLAKAVVGRASWTIDTRRSLAVEAVERQDGSGFYGKFEYSQMLGQHWRVTGQLGVIRGSDNDFLGQYHRNSFGNLIFRYSF